MRRISPRPSTQRRSLRRVAIVGVMSLVAGALAGSVAASSAQAASTATADEPLPVGASAGSANITLLANLPKPAPFDLETSYNSDLAFQGRYAFGGNYDGFVVYDIANPKKP